MKIFNTNLTYTTNLTDTLAQSLVKRLHHPTPLTEEEQIFMTEVEEWLHLVNNEPKMMIVEGKNQYDLYVIDGYGNEDLIGAFDDPESAMDHFFECKMTFMILLDHLMTVPIVKVISKWTEKERDQARAYAINGRHLPSCLEKWKERKVTSAGGRK